MRIFCGDRFLQKGYPEEWRIIKIGTSWVRLQIAKLPKGVVCEERTVWFEDLARAWELVNH